MKDEAKLIPFRLGKRGWPTKQVDEQLEAGKINHQFLFEDEKK